MAKLNKNWTGQEYDQWKMQQAIEDYRHERCLFYFVFIVAPILLLAFTICLK
jgi:hypothetical protein